ncbi:MAG: DUF3071 domain-containing protein [Bifidobacteriaceae bacterium]|jgi:hypothetical protein|nr:DUF3071 domain-containing protein [Bifidobacteriaceae bacterium]
MSELTFGRAEGDRLICVDQSGVEFGLAVDAELHTAVNQVWRSQAAKAAEAADAAEPGVQIPRELRPKDIQSLVRAGADPAELAEASGLGLDHVTRYAAPVLDERQYVSRQARRLALRHDPDARPLEEVVFERLARQGIEPTALVWDAVRQPHGWVMRLDFDAESGPVHARWQVDLAGRALTALNDQAQWIGRGDEPDLPLPLARHLSAVPAGGAPAVRADDGDGDYDDQPDQSEADPALSLLDGLMSHRGLHQPAASAEDARPAASQAEVFELRRSQEAADSPSGADGVFTAELATGLDEPSADFWGASGGGDLFDQAPVETRPQVEPFLTEAADPPPEDDESEPVPERATRSSRSQAKRSSVPSWDEIVFGSTRADQ